MKPVEFFLLVSEHRTIIHRIALQYKLMGDNMDAVRKACPLLITAEKAMADKIDQLADQLMPTALLQAGDGAIEKIYEQLKIQKPYDTGENSKRE